MSRTRVAFFAVTAGLTAALAFPSARRYVSVPVILQVIPAAPSPSPSPQAVAVNGHDFQPGLSALLTTPDGGKAELRDTAIQMQGESSFKATVLLDRPGTYALAVTNQDGGASKPFAFEVKRIAGPGSPAIDDVTPHDPHKDPAAQDLHVSGRAFSLGMRVRLMNPVGEEVADATVSRITPNAFDLKAALSMSGDYELVVVDAAGGTSNVWRITVSK